MQFHLPDYFFGDLVATVAFGIVAILLIIVGYVAFDKLTPKLDFDDLLRQHGVSRRDWELHPRPVLRGWAGSIGGLGLINMDYPWQAVEKPRVTVAAEVTRRISKEFRAAFPPRYLGG